MSSGVDLVKFKVAELLGRNRFGCAAVGMGFERDLVADCAKGWDMDVTQMEEVERRVMDQELTDDGMRCRKGREHADGSKCRNRATRCTWQESSKQHTAMSQPAQTRCIGAEQRSWGITTSKGKSNFAAARPLNLQGPHNVGARGGADALVCSA